MSYVEYAEHFKDRPLGEFLFVAAKREKAGEWQKTIDSNIMQLLTYTNTKEVKDLFCKLAMFKPLTPLTGVDNEWLKMGENEYQNTRMYSVFKKTGDNPRVYWSEGRLYKEVGCYGHWLYFSSVGSRVDITFPFIPCEPEIIEVGNHWLNLIKIVWGKLKYRFKK